MKKALTHVAASDVEGLLVAQEHYGDSWKKRGGVGAYMMMARKWDRIEQMVSRPGTDPSPYDIFGHCLNNVGGEGVLDSVRDLRRYLLLVEAELVRRGEKLPLQRDNQEALKRRGRSDQENPFGFDPGQDLPGDFTDTDDEHKE